MKRRYEVYGLALESDLSLPLRPGRRDAAADASVCLEPIGEAALAAFEAGPEVVSGRISDHIVCVVEGGRRIVIDDRAPTPAPVMQTYVLGVLMATLLRQRGYAVIHASCLERGGRALAFIGHSGCGKSSTAEYFCRHGYRLVNDDVMAVALEAGGAFVLPGPPVIRLRADAGRWLGALPGGEAAAMEPGPEKTLVAREQTPEGPLPLTGLFFLNPPRGDANAAEPLEPVAVAALLHHHSRMNNVFAHPASQAANLRLCGRMARRAPGVLLRRRPGLDQLEHVRRVVEAAWQAG